MENLPKYYTTLFNAVTDAIELISRSEVSEAMACLVAAQQKAQQQKAVFICQCFEHHSR